MRSSSRCWNAGRTSGGHSRCGSSREVSAPSNGSRAGEGRPNSSKSGPGSEMSTGTVPMSGPSRCGRSRRTSTSKSPTSAVANSQWSYTGNSNAPLTACHPPAGGQAGGVCRHQAGQVRALRLQAAWAQQARQGQFRPAAVQRVGRAVAAAGDLRVRPRPRLGQVRQLVVRVGRGQAQPRQRPARIDIELRDLPRDHNQRQPRADPGAVRLGAEQPRQLRGVELHQGEVVRLEVAGARRRLPADDLPTVEAHDVAGPVQVQRPGDVLGVRGSLVDGERHRDAQPAAAGVRRRVRGRQTAP